MDGQIYAAAIEGKVKIFNATDWKSKNECTSHHEPVTTVKINRNPLFTILETNIAPKTLGWKMSFLLGRPPGRCYVSFGGCVLSCLGWSSLGF